jgi:hypothetical protein
MSGPNDGSNWESLWDDLGLTTPQPTSRPTPVEAAPKPTEPRVTANPVAEKQPSSQQAEPISPLPTASGSTAEGAPGVQDEAAGGEEAKSVRRGRRRGRRSGRTAEAAPVASAAVVTESVAPPQEAAAPPEVPAAPTASTPSEAEAQREERRGRRRRRRRRPDERESGARAENTAPDVEREEPTEVAADAADKDFDDEDDLSNWSVPPWQDLISSLYRPER